MMAHQGLLKRPAPTAVTSASKVPYISSDTGDEEWACPKCGNNNFAGRLFCNMRKCQAPKPAERWTCPGCGNDNYEGRLFCNLRKCGLAKPGLTAADLAKATVGGLGGLGAMSVSETLQHAGVPVGSWKCLSCGNVNYPQRAICNGQSGRCGQPRTMVDRGATGGRPLLAIAGNLEHLAGAAKPAGGATPPGSWVCLSCQNVNYPTRSTCNGRACGRAREEVDGGPPVPGTSESRRVGGGNGEAPPGSWICQACQNVNWPGRESCNKRSCGLPRST